MNYKNVVNSSLKRLDLSEVTKNEGFVEFEGYASVFYNVDAYGDIVRKGAFKNSLAKRQPILLYQHNTAEPIGKCEAYEDDYGLYVKLSILSDLKAGATAIKLIENGIINGLSIGYNVVRSKPLDTGGKELIELDLYEVSLVTFPANDLSRIEAEPKQCEATHDDCYYVDALNACKYFNQFFKKGV